MPLHPCRDVWWGLPGVFSFAMAGQGQVHELGSSIEPSCLRFDMPL